MTIPMTARHIALIREGRKTTTLRSLKDLYHINDWYELPDGTSIYVRHRQLVFVAEDFVAYCDVNMHKTDGSEFAEYEGYSSWPEVVAELKKMRHKLPKRMWLYTFEVCE